jgi:hypothetical protein
MRLPGTINLPEEHKRKWGRVPALARLVEFRGDRRYPLDEFTAAKPAKRRAWNSLYLEDMLKWNQEPEHAEPDDEITVRDYGFPSDFPF